MSSNRDIPNELYYLDDDFSVRSLLKDQLKKILTAHNIEYRPNIRRVDLINLFKENIKSRRQELLMEYEQRELAAREAEPAEELGRGHRASHRSPLFAREAQVKNKVPKRRQKHTEDKFKKDKDGYAIPAIPANRKQTKPTFNPEDSFDELDEHPVVATTPLTMPPLQKQLTSVSSSDLKCPTVVPARKSSRRTKFDPPSFNPEDSFDSSSSGDEDDQDSNTAARKIPQKSPNRKPENDEDIEDPDYQADEDASDDDDEEELGDVDKEELVQLFKDQAIPAEELVAPEYSMSTRSQTMAVAKDNLLLWKTKLRQIGYVLCGIYMFFALICLGITAYARQKNGYCQNYPNIINEKSASPSFFSLLPSPCIPCPDHGICAGGELTCDTLYERKTPLYNIGHRFPIADDCIHNSVLGKYVARVERRIKNKLATHQGESACKHLLAHADVEEIEPAPIARVLVKDILSNLKDSIHPPLPADKADEIMVIALSAVLEDPKIHYWEIDGNRYLGTEHVQYSTKCQLERLYKKTPFNVKMMILTFISVASAFIGASRDYKRSKIYRTKIDILVKDTIERLMKQYENHLKDPIQYPSAAISVYQIRSSIVDVNDSKTIKDWQSVVEQIESHPHIRKSFQEIRGEPVEYWELTV